MVEKVLQSSTFNPPTEIKSQFNIKSPLQVFNTTTGHMGAADRKNVHALAPGGKPKGYIRPASPNPGKGDDCGSLTDHQGQVSTDLQVELSSFTAKIERQFFFLQSVIRDNKVDF